MGHCVMGHREMEHCVRAHCLMALSAIDHATAQSSTDSPSTLRNA